jgi:histone deacetylase complex regulatory component SIN3
MKVFWRFAFVSLIFLTSCANRGFYLSQQIPGVDNNLNTLPQNSKYYVRNDGVVVLKRGIAKNNYKKRFINREISSEKGFVRELKTGMVPSTLAPNHYGLLLNN